MAQAARVMTCCPLSPPLSYIRRAYLPSFGLSRRATSAYDAKVCYCAAALDQDLAVADKVLNVHVACRPCARAASYMYTWTGNEPFPPPAQPSHFEHPAIFGPAAEGRAHSTFGNVLRVDLADNAAEFCERLFKHRKCELERVALVAQHASRTYRAHDHRRARDCGPR